MADAQASEADRLDGSLAAKARLGPVCGLAVEHAGNFCWQMAQFFDASGYSHSGTAGSLASTGSGSWRRATAFSIAGCCRPGFSGDGDPAILASLTNPSAIAFWPGHGILVNDDSRLRLIYPPSRQSQVCA